MLTDVTVRQASADDRASVLELVPRLRAFGSVPFRPGPVLDAGETRTLERYFASRPEGTRLWVAEQMSGLIVGMAYAECLTDYFTQQHHGHLGILVVAEQAEGLGVGRALVRTVEDWTRESGLKFLTLNVFAGNERARAFYERSAFQLDTLRYIKAVS